MTRRDPLAAAIAQATLAMPVAQAPVVDDDPNAPVNLLLLDEIYSDPDPEDGPAAAVLDALLLLLAGEGWAALSDENHQGLIASLEHTCSVSIPGHKLPSICGSVPCAWGTVSGAIAARAIECLAIAVETGHPDARAADIGQLWRGMQRYDATPLAMRWAMRALAPHIDAAQAEVTGWPPERLAIAQAHLEDLR